jgi:hypothetical protein
MKFLKTTLFLFFLFFTGVLKGQESPKKYSIESYISNLQSVIIDSLKGNWISDYMVHNRINFFIYPNEHFTLSAQMRNRFFYGESVKYNPGYAVSVEKDQGYMNLSVNLFSQKSYLLNTTSDRLHLKYSNGRFVGTIGRQRINWGQNYVWNPNDIFNVQNFFDFDYEEKSGSDALRLQFYTGETSLAEFAIKLDHNQNATTAAYYRFNKWGYDFQVLGGLFEGADIIVGGGFAGHIKSAGFNGELSYFRPTENFSDTSSMLIISVGGDYVFGNSLHLQFESMYQHAKSKDSIDDFFTWYTGNLNVKNLSFSDFSMFANLAYPITPLINASLSGTIFPEINGYFAGPSFAYSASDNMELSFVAQYFNGILPDPLTGVEKRSSLFLGFLKFRISF